MEFWVVSDIVFGNNFRSWRRKYLVLDWTSSALSRMDSYMLVLTFLKYGRSASQSQPLLPSADHLS
jgi:hypothetical protein